MRSSYDLGQSKERFAGVFVVLVLCFLLILMRLAFLQLWRGSYFERVARSQVAYSENQGNPRGLILDRNGEELAVSIMCESLYVDPSQIVKRETKSGKSGLAGQTAKYLAPILNLPEEKLQEQCAGEGSFVWLKRTLSPEESRAVHEAIDEHHLVGLHFIPESRRYYTKKRIAAQVLGFVGLDDKGGSGLEHALDRELRGAVSQRRIYYNARGGELVSDLNNIRDTVPTVFLTLDMKIQYTLERAIDEALTETKAKGAAAILMDPHTGEILAMVSRPTFDPNRYFDYADTDWQNRCIGYNYEPGSVFKPIVGCAAMMCGIVKPDSRLMDNGVFADKENKIEIENWDYKYVHKGRGEVTFADVIKYSLNTGMAQVGLKLGRNNLQGFAEAFGFGQPTGIELAGEESGILHDYMYPADVAVMSLGQGIAVTPLQMLTATCAIANGGQLLRPYIVKKIVAPNGEVTREGHKYVRQTPISKQVADQMRYMMEQVVESGGGQTAAIKGYRIAGKTGTAQKLTNKGVYAEEAPHIASFVGFVPANDPKYAMLVMLDEPQGRDFYGGQVASPVFRNTLQQILAAKGIQPNIGDGLPSFDTLKKEPAARVKPKAQITEDGRIYVPDFQGADIRGAAEAGGGKLRIIPHGSGRAYKQEPAAGTLVPEEEVVNIWFR